MRLAVEEKKDSGREEKLPPWILNTFKPEYLNLRKDLSEQHGIYI